MQLTVEQRNIFGKKLKPFREEGKLPAVLYGAKVKSKPLFVVLKDFVKAWKGAGESTIIELKEGEKGVNALIQDVAIDPIKNEPIHVDFLAVQMDKLITASVPLVFEGIAPAVKEAGGVLVKVMHELEVEALPKDLPHELKINIEKLSAIEDKITIKDIDLPEGVKVTGNPDEAVILVESPREEEAEEAAPANLEDIEVEKKGKKEVEGEGEEKK
ncbi:MAG: 50S ribosomal protein L25 [bacterium]|nr:50S ribosomal protein L25 [bacterium]